MTTVTGFTAERMLAMENATVIDGEIVGDDLILKTKDNTEINAGNVRGPQGIEGPMGEVSTSAMNAAIEAAVNAAHGVGAIDETQLATASVTTNKIANNAVTTAKINDGAVSTNKLANNAITNAKIADNTITAAKAAREAFTGYTPSTSNLTLGSGGHVAGRYQRVGNRVYFYIDIALGVTPTVGAVIVSLPVPSKQDAAVPWNHCYHVKFIDSNTGAPYKGDAVWVDASNFKLKAMFGSNGALVDLAAGTPFTWAQDDRIFVSGWYEAA